MHTSCVSTAEAIRLVDSPGLSGLSGLTQLATQTLGVRVALASLITDREQFLLCTSGPSQPWTSRRRIPLSHSFHRYMDDSDLPLVLDDARLDERASKSLAISELGVIAYAGFPLRDPDGHVLGSFSAIDTEPRQWSRDDLAILSNLAAVAASEITLLLANHDLSQSVSWLQDAVTSTREGFGGRAGNAPAVNLKVLRQIADACETPSSRSLIEAYLELADTWVAEFVAAAHEGDTPRMSLIAHVLGPSSALFGAQPLADLLVSAAPKPPYRGTTDWLVLAAASVSSEYEQVAAILRAEPPISESASSTIPAQRTVTANENPRSP